MSYTEKLMNEGFSVDPFELECTLWMDAYRAEKSAKAYEMALKIIEEKYPLTKSQLEKGEEQ